MSVGTAKTIKWSDKILVKKTAAYVAGLAITLIIVFFKLRPYFDDQPMLHVFLNGKDNSQQSKKMTELNNQHLAGSLGNPGLFGNLLGKPRGASGGGSGEARPKNFVIERPLFDGSMVTLKAVLTQSISSSQGTPIVEAKLIDGADLGGSYEVSFLKDATLTGTGSANFETKRYNLQFSELITPEGKHYSIVAFGFDDGAQAVGVAANYSSGLASRMAGAALSRAIRLGEDVGTARVLSNSGAGDSVAAMEMNRAVLDTTHQATGDISDEATSGLRSVKPELSLTAGTVFTIKLKANSQSRGGGS